MVTIKQLTDSVGISKGAFYLFYPSKEHLFYALLRQMHTELYGPAMELLEQLRARRTAADLRHSGRLPCAG